MKLRRLLPVLMALLAAACGDLNRLPDGQLSFLSPENKAARAALQISPVSAAISYRPVSSCTYADATVLIGGQSGSSQVAVAVRAAGVRLELVETFPDGNIQTSLMDRAGRVYDYNGLQASGGVGGRVTPENQALVSQHVVQDASKVTSAPVNGLNKFLYTFPAYVRPSLLVGQDAAYLSTLDGAPWGVFVYRGLTSFQGRQAILLDLVKTPSAINSAYVTGYDLVDPDTGLPLLNVMDGGFHRVFKQVSCG